MGSEHDAPIIRGYPTCVWREILQTDQGPIFAQERQRCPIRRIEDDHLSSCEVLQLQPQPQLASLACLNKGEFKLESDRPVLGGRDARQQVAAIGRHLVTSGRHDGSDRREQKNKEEDGSAKVLAMRAI
jgi:hypothetical protein